MKYITTIVFSLLLSILTIAQKPTVTGQGSDKKVQDTTSIRITPGSSGVKRSIGYKFSSIIGVNNPGTGIFRFDKDNISLVTNFFVNNFDIKGEDQTNWYETWEKTTGASGRGGVTIADSKGKVVGVFNFTGVFIKGNGFWKFPVEYISGTMPLNGSDYFYVFERITHKKPKPAEPTTVVATPVATPPVPVVETPVVTPPVPVVETPVVIPPVPVVETPVVTPPVPVVETPVVTPPAPVTEVDQSNQRTQRIVKTEVTEPTQPTKRPPRQSVPVTQRTQIPQPTQSTQSTQVSQRPQPTQEPQPTQQSQATTQLQPKQQTQPVYPPQPAQQPQPTQQSQPTYPTYQTQQTQPTYPIYPPQPTQQTQPTYPAKPTQQYQAGQSTRVAQSTTGNQPVQNQANTSNQGRIVTQMDSPYQVTQDNQVPYSQSRERIVSGSRSKWYRGIIEAGYAFGLGDYGINNFRFNFINGVHLGKFSSLGLGIGYRKLFTENNSAPYLASNMSQIPVFLDFRTNFSTRPVTPYLSVGLGTLLESGTSETSKGRYLFNTSGGIWFNLSDRFAVFAGIDFEMMNLEFSDSDPFTNNYKKNSNSIGINVGISF